MKETAEFAILEITEEDSRNDFYTFTYNTSKVFDAIKNSELNGIINHWDEILVKMILTGEDYPTIYINKILRMATELGYEKDLDKVPMEIWHKAMENLFE